VGPVRQLCSTRAVPRFVSTWRMLEGYGFRRSIRFSTLRKRVPRQDLRLVRQQSEPGSGNRSLDAYMNAASLATTSFDRHTIGWELDLL
jgi:hypothetical protein